MSVPTPCPPPPDLERYVLGQLPATEAASVKQHILACLECQKALESFWHDDTLVGSLQTSALPDRSSGAAHVPAKTSSGNPHEQETMLPAPAALTGVMRGEYDFLAPAEEPDELGRLGPYRVLKVLGTGGMGVVFLAEDPGLKRLVALKTMKPAVAISAVNRQRFLREARSAAAIEHDHIVSIFQVGEAQGVPFLAMQLLHGESLDDRLKRDGRLPITEVLQFGREMAEGLSAAHQAGIVHRDMKPSNVWLEELPDGRWRVRLVDFGLARGGVDDPHLTEAGFVVGTPAYMSPEQAQGQQVDARGDLFSLGSVLFHISTGNAPFRGQDVLTTLMAVASAAPTPPRQLNPEIPPALEKLILQLLAKYPHERPATAQAVAEALAEIEAERTLPAMEVSGSSAVRRASSNEEAALPSSAFAQTSTGVSGSEPASPRSASLAARLGPPTAAALLLVGVLGTAGYLWRPELFTGSEPTPDTHNDHVAVIEPTSPATRPVTVADTRPRNGKLIITTESKVPAGLEIVIKQQGKTVRERTAERRIDLLAGEYQIQLAEYVPNTEVSPALVKIKAGQDAIATLKLRRMMVVPKRGEPLSTIALVSEPAVLDGVHSWTVETREHRGPVRSVAYSPNGKYLATAGDDGTVRLWDGAGDKLERILVGHKGPVGALAWSPNSLYLASRGHDKQVCFWEVTKGTLFRVREQDYYQAISWSADSSRVALNVTKKEVHVWLMPDAKNLPELKEDKMDHPRAVAYSPDGKWLATAGSDKIVRLWSQPDGKTVVPLTGHSETVTALAWTTDGKLLASGSRDSIRIWDIERGELLRKFSLETSPKSRPAVFNAQALAWQPTRSGRRLASINNLGVQLWSVNSDKPSHTNSLPGHSLSWSPDGKTLAVTLSDDETVRLLEADTLKSASSLPGQRTERTVFTSWSLDGRRLATVDEDRVIRLWDGSTGRLLHSLPLQTSSNATAVTWAPDGKRLAAVTPADGKVRLWDTDSGKALPSWTTPASLTCVAWSHNGKTLVAAGDKPARLFFFDTETGKLKEPKLTQTGHEGAVTALSWVPDAMGLISSGTDGKVLHWGPEGRRRPESLNFTAYKQGITAIAWSRDGKQLATAGMANDAPVKIWDREGKLLKELKDHQVKIVGLVFSRDGNMLIGRGDDSVLRSWDIATGKLQTVGRSLGVDLLPERGLRATIKDGAFLRLWDFAGTKPLATLVALTQGPSEAWLVLTPEGRYHSSVGLKDTIRYVVQTDEGQKLLRPDEFRESYKWKDDLDRVQLPTAPR